MLYLTWDDPGHDPKLSPGTQGNAVIVDFRRKTKGTDRNMNDIQNTSTEGTQTGTEGKTFTQEDVNRIVQERLAKERSKTAGNGEDELNKRAAELDLRERKLTAREKLRENGLPDYLVDALNMNTDDDFQKSMEAILKMKGETESREPKPIGKGNLIGMVQSMGTKIDDPIRTAFGLKQEK